MATKSAANKGTNPGSTDSRYDDEAEDDVATIRDFLKGERAALWPVWVLFLIMVAVIVWDGLLH